MSSLRTVALVAAAAVLVPSAATADTPLDELPAPTSRELQASVHPLNRAVRHLSVRSVRQLSASVTELAQESSSEGERVLTLTSDILFGFDSSTIGERARQRIAGLVADLPKGAVVAVEGHTDSRGSDAYNRRLSTERARAVAAVVRRARPDLRLTVAGYGATRPVAPNTSHGQDDPVGRAKNRRVEIRIGS